MTKNQTSIAEKHNKTFPYSLLEAIKMVKKYKFGKFDESVDLAINLDVDPRHAEENIRVTTPLPHGTGNKVSILVLTSGPKEKEALDAGADFVGNKEFLTKIKNVWTDVDKIVATPDMMGVVGRIGKILGPKGLMPNPKLGTVTSDVKDAVEAAKSGQVQYRAEKTGIVQAGVGKVSFGPDKLVENVNAFIEAIQKSRPTGAKGTFIKKISISSTMGVGINVNI